MSNRAFALADFSLIELTGEDHREWLQGQATNDVRGVEAGGSLSFCFCEPTGGILAILDAWPLEDRIVLSTARERVAAVLERIETMTILEDVAARELPLRGLWTSAAPADESPGLRLPSGRTAEGGWEEWVPEAAFESRLAKFEIVDAEPLRIGAGVPKWGADAGPRTLPPELGKAFEATHVSYSKGCYTGQEVLMRMHSRGHTNRTWIGLLTDVPLQEGAAVRHNGKEVGRVSSAAATPLKAGVYVAAAVLRNEATFEGERVEVGGVEAEVRTMPILRAS